jgi:hypothetical protein
VQARAQVQIKKESVRLPEVQQLLTWVFADGMSPTWAFIQVNATASCANRATLKTEGCLVVIFDTVCRISHLCSKW